MVYAFGEREEEALAFETTYTRKPLLADRAGREFDYLVGQVTGTIIAP